MIHHNPDTPPHPPLFVEAVPAGFPSPAEDYIEGDLDLNDLVVEHPAATFYVRASGDSMIDAGIRSGDLLVVDRALEAHHGSIVIAVIDGELTVKRLVRQGRRTGLVPANPNHPPLPLTEESQCEVWGVVRCVIHSCL